MALTVRSTNATAEQESNSADPRLGRTLAVVLAINLVQCAAGVAVGVWASSTALLGVALDNLADGSVYGLSLYAIGRSRRVKARVARLSGWLLIVLAGLVAVEASRRFFGDERPIGPAMMGMAAINVAVNLVCLRLLSRHRGADVTVKASQVFTSNDSIINFSTVLSGALVMWLDSNVPDLLLALAAAGVAAHGGKEILSDAANERPAA